MANSKTIRAADGGYLLDAAQFKYTTDELGRPVLTILGGGTGSGDFMADGSVPMTGDLQLAGHAIFNCHSISGEDDEPVAIESDADMNNHRITSLAAPASDYDATPKVYVDSKVYSLLPAITASAEGKVLGVVNGALAWVDKA